jgi:hypothetical protein
MRRLLLILLLLLPSMAWGRAKLQGYAQQGNTTLTITGAAGTISTKVQGSFPSCTVTVYLASDGTTLATLYSDNIGTAKANPFTSSTDGSWFFYADDGRYNVKFSGTGITTPFTLGDFNLFDNTAGTTGQILRGVTGSAAVWSTSAYPSTTAQGDLLYASAANTVAGLTVGTVGQILRSNGTIPAWTTAAYPTTTTANQLLYSSSANVVAGLTSAASGVLVTSAASVPSIATDIPTAVTIGSAYIYRASGTDVPLADGGTNASLTAVNGGVAYSGASALALTAAGTAGQVLRSVGAGTPVWKYPGESPTALTETSDAVALNCALNDTFTLTPADDGDAFTLSNPTGCAAGRLVTIIVTNNATAAGETITYGANYTVLGSVASSGALSAGNSDKTYITLRCTSATAADVTDIAKTTP